MTHPTRGMQSPDSNLPGRFTQICRYTPVEGCQIFLSEARDG